MHSKDSGPESKSAAKKDYSQPLSGDAEREVQRQLKLLSFGVAEITPLEDFVAMLRHSIDQNKPLRVKCGIDPTGTDVHLGHTVPYRKMRQFQDLGHVGVVIIGDYTAGIGDPTGRNEARPALTEDVIKQNAHRYMEQVYTVLNRDKTEISYQSEWFRDFSLRDIIRWASQTTVAKLLGHDTFHQRLEQGQPLALHELFYPMLQGIDSVFVQADVELGGSDQKFNVLMGRDYQRNSGQRPQVAMLLPIITGTDGQQKMSKSLGNYIGILDDSFDKFGKVMSIPDKLIVEYYKYLTSVGEAEVARIEQGLGNGSLHPNEIKKQLGQLIVGFFHGADEGQAAREKFEAVFKKGEVPDDAPEVAFDRGVTLIDLLVTANMVESKKEGRRLIQQNAVSLVNAEKLDNADLVLDASFAGKVLKIGKRKFLKLI